jgi:tetratricopeptide (TPR) repeat protein
VLEGVDASNEQQLSYTDEDAARLAQELIADVDADPIPRGPMFVNSQAQHSAWWYYVKGCALGYGPNRSPFQKLAADPCCRTLGWYHRRKGSYQLASEYFDKAALEYPEDDELHPLMLRSSMEAALQANVPLKEALRHFKRVRHAIPKVSELWQGSVSEPILVHDSQDIPKIETQELYNLILGRRTLDSGRANASDPV